MDIQLGTVITVTKKCICVAAIMVRPIAMNATVRIVGKIPETVFARRKVMSKAIVPGSLGAIANRENVSLAESFLNAEVVVIVDTSGSMGSPDAGDGVTRYDKACSELMQLQQRNSGKVAVIGYSDFPMFYPGGKPDYLGSGTAMAKALKFTRVADVPGMTFFLISDGQPTDGEEKVIRIAQKYQNKINTIYCGPEGGPGQRFLSRLAQASGGRFATAEKVKELASTVETLLLEE
jgi:Mg-chelatase subunit ChlD